jgi:hypothetical protein
MERDDMQALWHDYSARLDASIRLNAAVARQTMLASAQTAFDRIKRNLTIEIVLDILVVVVLGAFGADKLPSPTACAVLFLDAYAIAILGCAIAQLVALASIAYDQPVLAIAQRFERFTLIRARATLWTLAFGPLMWIPLLVIVLTNGRLIDANTFFGSAWFLANLAFGVVVVAVAALVVRRYDRPGADDAPVRRFVATISGGTVRAAAQRVEALRRYEAESDSLTVR